MKSNIWKFYTLRIFLRSLVFPILIIYFLRSGLSATEVGLVFAIGVYAGFLLELPSGYVSDRVGHKTAITVCFLMKALSMLFYLGGTFWWFVFAEVLFVGGGALWSGTGEAFLFETAKDLNRSDDFEKVYGRSIAVGLSISSGFLILMPFIYTYNNQLVFFVNFALLLLPLGVSLTLHQPSYRKPVAKVEGWWSLIHEWRTIGRFIITNKRYRTLVFFYAFWQAIQDAIDIFSQLFFTFIKIPTQFFGALYAVNRLLQAAGGQIAYVVRRTMSSTKILALFSVELILFFFFGAYANQYFGLVLFPARNFFEGMSVPIRSGMINKEIVDGYRITLLSVKPTIRRLIQGILVFALGILFDTFSVPHVFMITGVTTVVILSVLYAMTVRSLTSERIT